jgi:hypothetical protein
MQSHFSASKVGSITYISRNRDGVQPATATVLQVRALQAVLTRHSVHGAFYSSIEAAAEMTESAYHDLADAWIGSLEESLEGLDEFVDDMDISNAVSIPCGRQHFKLHTTLL